MVRGSSDGRYLTLAQVARRTGRHPEQLRQWCASGRLPCERFGRDWLLDERDLALVGEAVTRRRRPSGVDGTVVAAVFADASAGRRALSQARQRLGIGPRDAKLAPLEIDHATFVLVAAVVPSARVREVVELWEGQGGTIVGEVGQGAQARSRAETDARSREERATGT